MQGWHRRGPAFALYAGTLATCTLILTWQLRLWRVDLRVPLAYTNDGLVSAMYVKAVMDHGWYYHIPSLGAPAGLDLADFPMADSLHFLLVKALALFTDDHVLVFNGYFLLTFPLTALSGLLVLRHFGVAPGPAAVAVLLFTFLPYHFFRGPHHLWLAAYFMIPPLVMVALWLHDGNRLAWVPGCRGPSSPASVIQDSQGPRKPATPNWACALAICALVSSAGAYYAFFSCFLLLVAGAAAGLRERHVGPIGRSLACVAVVGLGFALNFLPTLRVRHEQGPSTDAVVRHAGHAELEGLKLAQLLLPVYDHPVKALADLRLRYRTLTPVNGENDWVPLGLAGSAGFLLLLGWLASRRADAWHALSMEAKGVDDPARPSQSLRPRQPGCNAGLKDGLAVLNLACVLLGCVGGLGSVVAFLISPMIRAYNRVAIYIAFLAFFMLALALDAALRRWGNAWRGRLTVHALLILILTGGIYDMTSGHFRVMYAQEAETHAADRAFARLIEATLPEQALVFTLPYVPFPEAPGLHGMGGYDHLRLYLNSRRLRWSYGAMQGRVGDVWQGTVAGKPPEQMLHDLAVAGFAGLTVDRAGYADRGAELESRLQTLLGLKPLVSRDGRRAFFDLTAFGRRVREQYDPGRLEHEREQVLRPVVFTWSSGFSPLEQHAGDSWRWCSRAGVLHVYNASGRTRRVTLELGLRAADGNGGELSLGGDLLTERIDLGDGETRIARTLDVPPGRHIVSFACTARAVRVPNDFRRLVFMVRNFHAAEFSGEQEATRRASAATGSSPALR